MRGGRFDRGMDYHRGRSRRDRLMMEEARVFRTKSHERVDYYGGPRGPHRFDEERDLPMEAYLSQPTTPYFPPGFGMPGTVVYVYTVTVYVLHFTLRLISLCRSVV